MLITGRQISAARGLLQWSAKDLADQAGLTQKTISQLEAEAVQPQEKTLTNIANLFDKHGVEFLDGEGVRVRQNSLRSYNGKTAFRQLLDHVFETLKNGGRVRQFNFNDDHYLSYADDFMVEHLKRMASIENLDARVLALRGAPNQTASYCDYRILDSKFRDVAPYYVYEDFVVLSLNETGSKKEFVTIHSKLLAERYSKEFDFFWSMIKKGK